MAVPGSQAKRRLRQLLHEEAARRGIRALTEPAFVTPGELLEELYRPPCKIADPVSAYFAWVQAAGDASPEDKAAWGPEADLKPGGLAGAGTAREAQRARSAVAAEGLTLQEIAKKCAMLPDVCGDKRWAALARGERAYLAKLGAAGLCDRDQARMDALAAGQISCERDIYLVGLQDMNGLDRAMLSALKSSVVAVIPAPEEEQKSFDAAGCLRTDCRQHADLHIPEDALWFVPGPAEETDALLRDIAALDGAFRREEITVGVGDEAAAESLARRLAVSGVPSYSPFGRRLPGSRPAALLRVVQEYLEAPSAQTFAALARHPDLEAWLTACRDNAEQEEDALPLLTQLDIYHAECRPEMLPTGEDARRLRDSPCPARAKRARAGVLAAHDAASKLTALLGGAVRPLPEWAAPILTLLRTVYRGTSLSEETAAHRQFSRALAGLTAILQEMQDLPALLAPRVSGPDALAFVLDQAQAVRLPLEPSSGDGGGIEMMGWLELALDDAPVMVLTGLQEGCVPAGGGDDPLLPDSLRQTLGLACDRRRQARDGLLLRQMIESRQAAGRHIRLIVSRQSADGTPRLPSRLLFACAPEDAARRARRFTHRSPSDAPALFSAGPCRAFVPPLPALPDTPLAEMGVSAFADYLACPYRFYLRHVLKLGEQEDSQREMDPRLFGVLLHDCLAAFAKSEASELVDPAQIRRGLKDELVRQSQSRFGTHPPPAIQMQIRQAGRRLEAFSQWQAQSVKDGWAVQPDFSEKELAAALEVDGEMFTIKGRLDRVDVHRETGLYRILDYKTGDSGQGPEEKHRKKSGTGGPQWTNLQLPLYRLLLAAQGADLSQIAPGEMGYVVLSADLAPFLDSQKNRGGTGFVQVDWTEADHESALACAEEVVRSVRAGKFWPPADPSPFPPSRLDPGRSDSYGGLCLDACADRTEWFQISTQVSTEESL